MFVILSPKTLKRSSNNSAENGREVKGGWGGFPESEKKIEFLVEIGNLCLPLSTRWRWWCCALSLPFCRVSFHQCQVQAHPSWAQLYTNFSTPLLNFTWEPQSFLKLYKSFSNNKTPNSNSLILPHLYVCVAHIFHSLSQTPDLHKCKSPKKTSDPNWLILHFGWQI